MSYSLLNRKSLSNKRRFLLSYRNNNAFVPRVLSVEVACLRHGEAWLIRYTMVHANVNAVHE